jgi:hypothetical protein
MCYPTDIVNIYRYLKRSTISEAKFRQMKRCFGLDFAAINTAQLTGLSVRPAPA